MPGGRPRKSPEAYLPKLCQALELGAWYWLACKYADVSYRKFRVWMVEGEAEDADAAMQAFARRIRQAEVTGALRDLRRINEAAQAGDWRAAAWLLERRFPAIYGKPVVEQRHRGTVDQTVRVVVHRDGEPSPDEGAKPIACVPHVWDTV